jgi:hypothetical protein
MKETTMNDHSPNAAPGQNPSSNAQAPSPGPDGDRGAARHARPFALAGPMGAIVAVGAIGAIVAASILGGLVAGTTLGSHSTVVGGNGNGNGAAVEHTIAVSGVGEVSVAPDVADVVVGVAVQKPTVAEAQSAQATAMSAVVAAVKNNHVDDKDIVTVNLSLSPVYDYSAGGSVPRLVGYQYANTVRITVRNIKSVAAVVDDAVAAGATTVGGISFRLDDPKTVQAQARQLAMADARGKADALTSAAGVSIKGVASIAETTTQTNPTYSAGAVDAAKAASVSTPIQTGTTDIVVQVTVSYLIG